MLRVPPRGGDPPNNGLFGVFGDGALGARSGAVHEEKPKAITFGFLVSCTLNHGDDPHSLRAVAVGTVGQHNDVPP